MLVRRVRGGGRDGQGNAGGKLVRGGKEKGEWRGNGGGQ